MPAQVPGLVLDLNTSCPQETRSSCASGCMTDSSSGSLEPSACCTFPFTFDKDGDGEMEEHNSCIEVRWYRGYCEDIGGLLSS